jgi:RNA polymerase sigma-70 factor (ECF subfamily)
MLGSVDSAAPNPDEAVVAVTATESLISRESEAPDIAPRVLEELWSSADAAAFGLTLGAFREVLVAVGTRYNYGLPTGTDASSGQREAFYRGLHLNELALAHACARGKDAAWERFVCGYRAMLTLAGTAITGSASLGEELADSLYAELYGLREADGERRSPFASYSGRGSLQGWLRTTLVQRFRDHYRRTHRESPLEEMEFPAPSRTAVPSAEPSALADAVARTLSGLAAEDRFLLAGYFLDRQTLKDIARTLRVHEATISRRLKRLLSHVRKVLLKELQRGGMSKRAAYEALGTDPRDLEINLRAVLQGSQIESFQEKTASVEAAASDKA